MEAAFAALCVLVALTVALVADARAQVRKLRGELDACLRAVAATQEAEEAALQLKITAAVGQCVTQLVDGLEARVKCRAGCRPPAPAAAETFPRLADRL